MNGSLFSLIDSLDSASPKTAECFLPPLFTTQVLYTPNQQMNVPTTTSPSKLLSDHPPDGRSGYSANVKIKRKCYRVFFKSTAQAFSAESFGKTSSFVLG